MTAGATRSDNGKAAGVTRRLTLLEAAQVLGISKEGVRKRVQRGTLRHEKDADGIVHVYISGADNTDNGGDGVGDAGGYASVDGGGVGEGGHDEALVDALRDHIASLERQLDAEREEVAAWREEARRKDHLMAGLIDRLPAQIEPPAETTPETPQDPQEAAQDVAGGTVNRDDPAPQNGAQHRSWWRRWFGLD